MTWFRWFAIGKQLVELAAELIVGGKGSFVVSWKGISYTVTVTRGG
jgi:hypothetical protein